MSRLLAACLLLPLVVGCDDKDSGALDDGGDVDYEAYRAQCEAFDNADDCRGHPPATDGGANLGCMWAEWVPVVYDAANEVCEFGEAEGQCEVRLSADPGCVAGGAQHCADVDALGVRRDEGGTVKLTKAPFCDAGVNTCSTDQGEWVHAECACLCDPAYPGASG